MKSFILQNENISRKVTGCVITFLVGSLGLWSTIPIPKRPSMTKNLKFSSKIMIFLGDGGQAVLPYRANPIGLKIALHTTTR